jgi:hypothetical protein
MSFDFPLKDGIWRRFVGKHLKINPRMAFPWLV